MTRRAFIPRIIVQLYQASPHLSALIANAQMASGGVSGVTVPVQGTAFVTTQASDYTGTFTQPAVQQGITNAEFNLKLVVTPIPFLGMEGAVQINAAVIPIIEARMNDAGNSQVDYLSTKLWNNSVDGLDILGLPGAIDDSTNLVTYAGINRTTNVFWKAVRKAMGAVNPTRNTLLQNIASVVKSASEMPTFGITSLGTWVQLATDYTGLERYVINPDQSFDQAQNGPRAAFTALMVGGVPVYADPFGIDGTIYLENMNYLNLYVHETLAWAFTGFASTLPNFQIGYVGALLTVLELVCVKPKAQAVITGYNFLAV